MRKGRNDGEVSSLDMLLDTMCNMFGCLIFLAILLSVISQQVGKVVTERSATKGISKAEWQRQSALIEEINARIRLNSALLKSEWVEPENAQADVDKELVEAIERLQARIEADTGEMRALKDQSDRQQQAAEALRRKTRELVEKMARLRQEQAQGETVKRQFSVPKLHDIAREAVMFCGLRAKKFYAITKIPPTGLDREEVNARTGENDALLVTLRPEAGMRIIKGTVPGGKLKLALQELDPDKVIVNFLVYEDSFAEFQEVKKLFLTLPKRFEYNWKPLKLNEPIVLKPVKEIKGGTVQ